MITQEAKNGGQLAKWGSVNLNYKRRCVTPAAPPCLLQAAEPPCPLKRRAQYVYCSSLHRNVMQGELRQVSRSQALYAST